MVRTTFIYLSMNAKVNIILTLNLLNNNFQITGHLPMYTCTSEHTNMKNKILLTYYWKTNHDVWTIYFLKQCDSQSRKTSETLLSIPSFCSYRWRIWRPAFPGGWAVKNPPSMQEISFNTGNTGSVPGWGRSPAEGNGNPLQYFCLANPMDQGDWRATVHGVIRVRQDFTTTINEAQHRFPGTPNQNTRGRISASLYSCRFIIGTSRVAQW